MSIERCRTDRPRQLLRGFRRRRRLRACARQDGGRARERAHHESGAEHRAGPFQRGLDGRQSDRPSDHLRRRHRLAGDRPRDAGYGRTGGRGSRRSTRCDFACRCCTATRSTRFPKWWRSATSTRPLPGADLAHYASAEVGEVRFRHWGVNERGETVFEGERRVLLKKRRAFRPARERADAAGTLARNGAGAQRRRRAKSRRRGARCAPARRRQRKAAARRKRRR